MNRMLLLVLLLVPTALNSAEIPLHDPTTCDGPAPAHKVLLPSGIFIPAHRFFWNYNTNTLHVVGVDPVRIFCSSF